MSCKQLLWTSAISCWVSPTYSVRANSHPGCCSRSCSFNQLFASKFMLCSSLWIYFERDKTYCWVLGDCSSSSLQSVECCVWPFTLCICNFSSVIIAVAHQDAAGRHAWNAIRIHNVRKCFNKHLVMYRRTISELNKRHIVPCKRAKIDCLLDGHAKLRLLGFHANLTIRFQGCYLPW